MADFFIKSQPFFLGDSEFLRSLVRSNAPYTMAKPFLLAVYSDEKLGNGNGLRDLATECKAIEKATGTEYVKTIYQVNTFKEIKDTFDKNPIQIFHFAGHAQDEKLCIDGKALFSDVLVPYFAKMSKNQGLVLVFLNGCATKAIAEAIEKASEQVVVIATHKYVNDTVAKKFSTEFYEQLKMGKTISEAFDNAREFTREKFGINTTGEQQPVLFWKNPAEWDCDLEDAWGIYGNKEIANDWKSPICIPSSFGDAVQQFITSGSDIRQDILANYIKMHLIISNDKNYAFFDKKSGFKNGKYSAIASSEPLLATTSLIGISRSWEYFDGHNWKNLLCSEQTDPYRINFEPFNFVKDKISDIEICQDNLLKCKNNIIIFFFREVISLNYEKEISITESNNRLILNIRKSENIINKFDSTPAFESVSEIGWIPLAMSFDVLNNALIFKHSGCFVGFTKVINADPNSNSQYLSVVVPKSFQ